MRRLWPLRAVILGLLFVGVTLGCAKDDSKPNPDLKVPDIPASGHGAKKMPKQPGKQ